MPDLTESPETATEPADTEPDTGEQTTPPEPDPDAEPDRPSRREARYRTQLRETEAERDQLAERLTTLQRAEVERLVAEQITKPAALWTAGVELADLLGDDGTVDPEKVATAAADARDQLGLEHPQAARLRGPFVPREGASYAGGGPSGGSTWVDAFKG